MEKVISEHVILNDSVGEPIDPLLQHRINLNKIQNICCNWDYLSFLISIIFILWNEGGKIWSAPVATWSCYATGWRLSLKITMTHNLKWYSRSVDICVTRNYSPIVLDRVSKHQKIFGRLSPCLNNVLPAVPVLWSFQWGISTYMASILMSLITVNINLSCK